MICQWHSWLMTIGYRRLYQIGHFHPRGTSTNQQQQTIILVSTMYLTNYELSHGTVMELFTCTTAPSSDVPFALTGLGICPFFFLTLNITCICWI